MQKKIIALAVAALASTAAFAQSNVTIYGIADASVSGTTYLGNAARQTQYGVNSGSLSTSRIGFKGVEDLGNGLKALFVLEYGLGIDGSNGIGYSTTTSAVARQQFVGLTGGFGTAVAGHLQTTGLDFTVAGSALGGSTGLGVAHSGVGLQAAAATHLISALAGGRHSNAVAYISPSFGGVTVAYNHARVSECAGTASAACTGLTGNTDAHGDLLSASYANGPITAGAIYTRVTLDGANNNISEWGLRAGYDFKVVKLQAQYQRAKSQAITTGSDSLWLVSATVPVGAKVGVIAEYAHTSVKSTVAADNVNAATVAATYSLSKRTTAYAGMAARRYNNGIQGTDSNTYVAGLRHSF
jgi:predicted porin